MQKAYRLTFYIEEGSFALVGCLVSIFLILLVICQFVLHLCHETLRLVTITDILYCRLKCPYSVTGLGIRVSRQLANVAEQKVKAMGQYVNVLKA